MFTPRLLLAVALVAALHTPTEVAEWLDAHVDAVGAYPRHATELVDARADFEARHRIVAADWSPCVPAAVDRFDPGCRIWSVEYAPPPTTTTTAPAPASVTEAPAPPPADTSMGSGVEQWRPLVEAHFGGNTAAAMRVMACESGGNPGALNSSSAASGLFQFLPSTWESTTGESYPGSVFDGASNIAAAAALSGGGASWQQWACKP